MILAGHQPNFLPWLGFFFKIEISDVFRIADYVKYVKQSWINRVKIKNNLGKVVWLSIPVKRDDVDGPINKMRIASEINWKSKIIEPIKSNYKYANYFSELYEIIEMISDYDDKYLVGLNTQLIKFISKELDIKTKIVIGSEIKIQKGKTEHIVDSCKKLNCDIYAAGQGVDYYDIGLFKEFGINLVKSDFFHPEYQQVNGSFIAGLSIIDAIANIGYEQVANLIKLQSIEWVRKNALIS